MNFEREPVFWASAQTVITSRHWAPASPQYALTSAPLDLPFESANPLEAPQKLLDVRVVAPFELDANG